MHMTWAPRQRFTVRRALHWVAGGIVAAQMATMVGLVTFNGIKRRGRRPYRFPTAPTEPLKVSGHRGVKVYAMWDTFANLVVDPRFFRQLEGVQVRAQPLVTPSWIPTLRNLGRDHRKLLIVDSKVAYIGGYNIGSLYADRWRDTHARITGPAVGELESVFVDMWNQRPKGALIPRRNQPVLPTPGVRYWDTAFAVHRNSPRMAVYPIRNMYLEAIDRASERIWMTQGYLIPDDDVVAALHQAASRGVDVRIVIPAESNHVIADWLSRGYYDRLLH